MIKNWCKDYEQDINPKVEMCRHYITRNMKPVCLKGHKAGLWCHTKPITKGVT